jgi:tetratricopeptide (TPR) repeat protein
MMVAWLVVAVLASGVSFQGSGTRQQPPRDRPGSRSAAQLAAEARVHYQAQRWADAAQQYEAALAAQPDLPNVRFFLANAYDNLASARGLDYEQRAVYLQRAAEYYRSASERERDPKYRRLAAEYLVAIYGPEKLNDPERAVPIVEALLRDEPSVAMHYYVLAKLYEDGGRYEDAERTLLRARDARPDDPSVYTQLGNFYNRQGDFERTMAALHSSADLDATNVRAHHTVAVFYWEKSYKDHRLRPDTKRAYVLKGLEAEDRALAIDPDYGDALSYKSLLLRMLGNLETDAARRAALYAEADVLRARAIELQKRRAGGGPPATTTASPPGPPPPATVTVNFAR